MKKIMPQEMEVWYLIPAIRRELAKIFIEEYGLKQKKAAQCLGMTEAAISQYMKSKRGTEIKFSDEAKDKIKKVAKDIAEKNGDITEEIYGLCRELKKSKVMCGIHKLHDKRVPKDCDICLRD